MTNLSVTALTLVDLISVDEYNNISVRTAQRYLRNGEVIGEEKHRHVLEPWQDISAEDARVQAVAAAVWTPELVAATVAARDDIARQERIEAEIAAAEEAKLQKERQAEEDALTKQTLDEEKWRREVDADIQDRVDKAVALALAKGE